MGHEDGPVRRDVFLSEGKERNSEASTESPNTGTGRRRRSRGLWSPTRRAVLSRLTSQVGAVLAHSDTPTFVL